MNGFSNYCWCHLLMNYGNYDFVLQRETQLTLANIKLLCLCSHSCVLNQSLCHRKILAGSEFGDFLPIPKLKTSPKCFTVCKFISGQLVHIFQIAYMYEEATAVLYSWSHSYRVKKLLITFYVLSVSQLVQNWANPRYITLR